MFLQCKSNKRRNGISIYEVDIHIHVLGKFISSCVQHWQYQI